MKVYRNAATGETLQVDETNKEQVAALEQAGFEVVDAKAKAEAAEKAKQAAAKALADAQAEMAARPSNEPPPSQVVAEGTVQPVTESKPPASGMVMAEGMTEPQPPKVPKKN